MDYRERHDGKIEELAFIPLALGHQRRAESRIRPHHPFGQRGDLGAHDLSPPSPAAMRFITWLQQVEHRLELHFLFPVE